jgi:hypothetical protein
MLFIFDENYPPEFVKGLAILEQANQRTPIKADIVFAVDYMGMRGADDTDIIKKATKQDAVIVTHDADFKRIKHYKPLLIEHSVGYIYFKVPKGGYHYWDIVKSFIVKWEDLKKDINGDTIPFAYEVSKTGQHTRLHF